MAEFAIRRSSGEGWTYVAEPKSSFQEFSEVKYAGDGNAIEIGYITVEWDYADRPLTGIEMYELLQFCSGASSSIQIRTKTNRVTSNGGPVFRIYEATMFRPDVEFDTRHATQRFINVGIRFKCGQELSS